MPKTKPTKKPLDLSELVAGRGLSKQAIEQEKQRLLRQQRLYALRELRSLGARTQTQLAEDLEVTQNRISKLERYEIEKLELRTISSYVEALGGTLALQVELEGKSFVFSVSQKH